MKGKIAFFLLLLIVLAAGWSMLDSGKTTARKNAPAIPAVAIPAAKTAPPGRQLAGDDEKPAVAEQRVQTMRAEYARLEQARAEVRLQLGRLKSRVWKLRLPAERARAIREQMQQGHAVLKNPPLLGAFHSAEDIRRESARVRSISNRLGDVEAGVEEYISAGESR